MQAIWQGQVLADSSETIVVEGNHYFPPAALDKQFFKPSPTTSVCGWKGTASYFDVVVGNKANAAAAWSYADPLPAAENIRDYVAFWKGVEVVDNSSAI